MIRATDIRVYKKTLEDGTIEIKASLTLTTTTHIPTITLKDYKIDLITKTSRDARRKIWHYLYGDLVEEFSSLHHHILTSLRYDAMDAIFEALLIFKRRLIEKYPEDETLLIDEDANGPNR